ncbi:hypothetical protein E2542_SST23581 [Spatholobus suberectus]|nr:hypothetical protein E2542_SST23581 [Spatholobus suberectus]
MKSPFTERWPFFAVSHQRPRSVQPEILITYKTLLRRATILSLNRNEAPKERKKKKYSRNFSHRVWIFRAIFFLRHFISRDLIPIPRVLMIVVCDDF